MECVVLVQPGRRAMQPSGLQKAAWPVFSTLLYFSRHAMCMCLNKSVPLCKFKRACVCLRPSNSVGENMLSSIAMPMIPHEEIMMMRPHFLALCHVFPSVLCLQQAFRICLCSNGWFKRKYKRKHNVVCSKKKHFLFLVNILARFGMTWGWVNIYFYFWAMNSMFTLRTRRFA